MTRFDLSGERPAGLDAYAALYCLGVGGPPDAGGIGDPRTFVWRFTAFEAGGGLLVLAFSAMPRLIAFTRAVNARRPFTVSTEALKLAVASLPTGLAVTMLVDPDASDFDRLAAASPLVERAIPELAAGPG